MTKQDHKAIFITGASSGLGRATAKLFASKEWKVIASMRDLKNERELASISGIRLVSLDVTDPHEIESVAQQVVASGCVDVVFNNGGYGLVSAPEGLMDLVGNDPHNKGVHPTLQREKGGILHQYGLDWRTDGSSI